MKIIILCVQEIIIHLGSNITKDVRVILGFYHYLHFFMDLKLIIFDIGYLYPLDGYCRRRRVNTAENNSAKRTSTNDIIWIIAQFFGYFSHILDFYHLV